MPNDPHPYCMNACEQVTMCGEVPVPEHHLEVSAETRRIKKHCGSKTSNYFWI